MAVLRRNDGEQLHQVKRQMGYRSGGGGFRAGERAEAPGGRARTGRKGRGGRMRRRCEGLELTRDLTRDADNVDIATYVSGLDTRCIL